MAEIKKGSVEGIPSEIDGELYTYGGGKILPAEWFDGDMTQEDLTKSLAATPEEIYIDMLQVGLPRNEAIEARIDMSQIPPQLLA